MEEDFYCGDIVEPGSHISMDDVIHYFNIFNGDVLESSLSPTQRKLLNILNSPEYDGVDKTNLNELYDVLTGLAASVLCVDRPVECCLDKNEIEVEVSDTSSMPRSILPSRECLFKCLKKVDGCALMTWNLTG